MEGDGPARYYHPKEERLNVLSHGLGFILSIIAFFLLLERSFEYNSTKVTFSYSIFGVGLILLYGASTFYHSTKNPLWRFRFKVLDHIAIFILIAGTYTPFALVTLEGRIGWIMFGISWGMAIIGTVLKLFYTGKHKIVSTLLYIGMGWIIIFAIGPLIERLSAEGLSWLFSGGVFYTMGAIVYCISKLQYNHAMFHLFVLLGSFSHFMAIYNHVHPIH